MQDSNERSTNGDDQAKAALHHLYQRQREQHNQEYPPDVQALLKQLPPNALPPVSTHLCFRIIRLSAVRRTCDHVMCQHESQQTHVTFVYACSRRTSLALLAMDRARITCTLLSILTHNKIPMPSTPTPKPTMMP
jgi:hypothetical protein